MKKKLLMVAVLLGGLSLGACVDDNESASVTNIRDAKAEQLRALATLSNAQAEAELIRANAEAALMEAKAAYKEALASQESAKADYLRSKYALLLEKLEAEYAADILQAQKDAAEYEQDIWNQASAEIQHLFNSYKAAVMQANSLNSQLLKAQFNLANAEVDRNAALTEYNTYVARQNNTIAEQTAKMQRLQSLGTDKEALAETMNALTTQAYQLLKTDQPAAEEKTKAAEKAFEEAELPISYSTYYFNADEEAAWRKVATPYVLAIDTLDDVQNEYNAWYGKRLSGNVYLVENTTDFIESENVLNTYTKSVTTWALTEGADYLKATQEIAYMFETKIADKQNEIGAPASGSTAATGYYLDLAAATANLKTAQDNLAAEQAKTNPDAMLIEMYQTQIAQYTVDKQAANDRIAEANAELADIREGQAAYTRNLKVATAGSEAQKAYAAAVETLNGLAVACIDAQYDEKVIQDKIDQIGILSFDASQNVSSWMNGEYQTAKDLYDEAISIEEAINNCQELIAEAEENLKESNNPGQWVTETVNVWDPVNGTYVNTTVQIWEPNLALITLEQVQAILQAEVDRISAELTIQQALVNRYKTALDAAIAAQNNGTPDAGEQPNA